MLGYYSGTHKATGKQMLAQVAISGRWLVANS